MTRRAYFLGLAVATALFATTPRSTWGDVFFDLLAGALVAIGVLEGGAQ